MTWHGDESMRVITVYNPYAWLMIFGGQICPELLKDVENRGYPTKYRGRLLIHASLRLDPRPYHDATWLVEKAFGRELAVRVPQWGRAHALPRGGIIGAVTLFDVREPFGVPASPWHLPGHYGWMLRDPVALPFYPVRGQQGLWGNYAIRGGEVVPA